MDEAQALRAAVQQKDKDLLDLKALFREKYSVYKDGKEKEIALLKLRVDELEVNNQNSHGTETEKLLQTREDEIVKLHMELAGLRNLNSDRNELVESLEIEKKEFEALVNQLETTISSVQEMSRQVIQSEKHNTELQADEFQKQVVELQALLETATATAAAQSEESMMSQERLVQDRVAHKDLEEKLQAQITHLKTKVATLSESQSQTGVVESLENRVKVLEIEIQARESQIIAYVKEKEAFELRIREFEASGLQVADLERQVEEVTQEKLTQEDLLIELESQIRNLKADAASYTLEESATRIDPALLAAREQTIQDLQAALVIKDKNHVSLEAERLAAEDQYRILQDRFTKVQESISAQAHVPSSPSKDLHELAELQSRLKDSTTAHETLLQKYAAANAQIQSLSQSSQTASQAHFSLESQLDIIQTELITARERIRLLESDEATLNGTQKSQDDKITMLEEQLEMMKVSQTDLEMRLQGQTANELVGSQLLSAQERIRELENDLCTQTDGKNNQDESILLLKDKLRSIVGEVQTLQSQLELANSAAVNVEDIRSRLLNVFEGAGDAELVTIFRDRLEKTRLEDTANMQILHSQLDELQITYAELQSEHQNLLDRVSQMKDVMGPKLQAEAELRTRLDAFELEYKNLSAEKDSYQHQVTSLHADLDKTAREVNRLRQYLLESEETQTQEILRLETELSTVNFEISRLHKERTDSSSLMDSERTRYQENESRVMQLKDDREILISELEVFKSQNRELEKTIRNLQDVLDQFEASKDEELEYATQAFRAEIDELQKEIEDQKLAVVTLKELNSDVDAVQDKTAELSKIVEEKTSVIAKLRHDVMQLQSHLSDALRHLKNVSASNDTTVDRRLISNLLMAFLCTPSGDTKRFDILNLIVSVLQFTEEEKFRVGLVRRPSYLGSASNLNAVGLGVGAGNGGQTSVSPGGVVTSPTTAPQENFADLFVSFLLREVEEQKK